MRKPLIPALAALLAMTPIVAQAKSLRIENKRAVALTELTITAKDGAGRFVLAKDIPARTVISRTVPRAACIYDVKGEFADQSTVVAQDMNLCGQHTIRLTQ